jgi:hypothetical protein
MTSELTILALRMETIYQEFFGYLAAPSGQEYLHDPSVSY